jgi:outer membrane lipoprotein-sorting protein
MKAISFFFLATLLALGASAYTDTPTADQILARSAASYDALKSYQATITVLTEIGGRREKLTLNIKAVNGDSGKILRSASEMSHSSTYKGITRSSSGKQIDDGETVFTVREDLKQYSKRPHAPEKVSGLFTGALTDAAASTSKLNVAVIQLHGKPVYELSSKQPDSELTILVEKQTYHLLGIRKWRAHEDGKSTLEMTVSNMSPFPPTLSSGLCRPVSPRRRMIRRTINRGSLRISDTSSGAISSYIPVHSPPGFSPMERGCGARGNQTSS